MPRGVDRQRVGAEFDQERDHLRAVLGDGEVQRALVVLVAAHPPAQLAGVGLHDPADLVREIDRDRREQVMARAAADQELRDLLVRMPARGPADHLEGVIVAAADHVAARVGEPSHHLEVPGCRRPVHRVRVVPGLAGVDVQAALQQQIYGLQVPAVRGGVEKRPPVRRVAHGELLVRERVKRADVAGLRRLEQS